MNAENHFDVLKRLTQLRNIYGYSVYKLAKQSGIPQSTIATWYQKNLYPPLDKLERICAVMGISLADFFQSEENGFMLSDEEEELLIRWRMLTENQRRALRSVLDEFLIKNDVKKEG